MPWNRKQIRVLFALVAFGVLLFVGLQNLGTVWGFVQILIGLLMPFIIGLCIAFILSVPMRAVETHLFRPLDKKCGRIWRKIRRPLAATVTLLLALGVLAAADVFLTHCGMNSVSEALFFDVPLVCCPQTQEQRGVANRVLALGAGLLLPDDSPQAIAQAIGIALSDPSYRAHAATIAQSFRESGGAPQAAETILQVIAQDRATGT